MGLRVGASPLEREVGGDRDGEGKEGEIWRGKRMRYGHRDPRRQPGD